MTKTTTIDEKDILRRILKNLDGSYTLCYPDYRDEVPATLIQDCIDKRNDSPLYEEDMWSDARHYAARGIIDGLLTKIGLSPDEKDLFATSDEYRDAVAEIIDRDNSNPEAECLRRQGAVNAYLRFHSNYDCWCGLSEYSYRLQVEGTALTAVLAALSLNPWKVKQAANRAGLGTLGQFRNIPSRNGKEAVDYDDFIKGLVNCPNYGNWAFFGRLDLGLMYEKNFRTDGLTIPEGTVCGMYNWWNGGGTLHFCKTIRPLGVKEVVTKLYPYKDGLKLVVDDKSNERYGHVPSDVYGAYYINKENLFI